MTCNYFLYLFFQSTFDWKLFEAHNELSHNINNIADFSPQLRQLLITCGYDFHLTIYYP
jgi:hypothetical protein